MDEWRNILSFPGYSVSDTGFIMNDKTGRLLAQLKNQGGIINVGLVRNGIQYKRSVALLVAEAFILTAKSLTFDTPINLDGDRSNNTVVNLVWRPRWFAIKYFQQFNRNPIGYNKSIEEMKTHEKFESLWEAAITFGLLEIDLFKSLLDKTDVWPTYQRFRAID